MAVGGRVRGAILAILCLGFLPWFALAYGAEYDEVNIWPMPQSASHGSQTLYLSKEFVLGVQGDKYVDCSGMLKEAFERMIEWVGVNRSINGQLPSSPVLSGVNVEISSPDNRLYFGIDESYKLDIPADGNLIFAQIKAQTIYGALHALQNIVEFHLAPWSIFDQPRFSYRGLLIDTSRHYLPMPIIERVIDSMAYSKMNVLHWHIVDEQSFPFEIPSYPKLWDGAYSDSERYSMTDALEIVQYAQRRGINVLPEIDVPGHALSWGVGYRDLWPSVECKEPLDVSKEFTFKVIDGILSDFAKVFKFKFVHLGGDEVDTSCWTNTQRIKKWLTENKMNASEGYKYFVLRAQKTALSHGYEVINWEETFNNFGTELSPKTVVHNWLGGGVAQKVVAAGLRCIVSNQDMWYLDHLDVPWQDFYMNEPLTGISIPVVIGGEVCMWGEQVDASDIDQTIWPRAAAAAERLWTPLEKLAEDPGQVAGRLDQFRCLLNQRGIAAAPLEGQGRDVPGDPGSCYVA